jgi:ABC-2 type transport system permease protein
MSNPSVDVQFVLGLAAMMALGSLVSARVTRASTGTAIGTVIFFPLLLTPASSPSSSRAPCSTRSRASPPLGAASQVMTYGWFGGDTFPWIQIVAMIGWTAVLTPLAVKLFRWQ